MVAPIIGAIGSALAPVFGGLLGNKIGSALGGGATASAVGNAIGTGLGNYASSAFAPAIQDRGGNMEWTDIRKMNDINLLQSKKMARAGGKIDRRQAMAQFDDRFQYLMDQGLTVTEAAGVPASGASQGATAVLGNAASQQNAQNAQIYANSRERALDRQLELMKTQMQANAQLGVAGIAADASRYGSDTSAGASMFGAGMSARAIQNAAGISAAAAEAIARITDKRERDLAILRMGTDNLLSTALARKWGIDPAKPGALNAADFQGFLQDYHRTQGSWQREVEGVFNLVSRYMLDGGEPSADMLRALEAGVDAGAVSPDGEINVDRLSDADGRALSNEVMRILAETSGNGKGLGNAPQASPGPLRLTIDPPQHSGGF